MDPLRLAAQIVSGVGFLGAGVILRRTDDSISGLTTAAMIWGAAGIGIAVGAGFYIPAIVAVLIVLFGVEVIAPIFFRLGPERLRMQEINVIIKLEQSEDIEKVIDYLKANDFLMESLIIKDTRDANHDLIHEIHIRFSSLPEEDTLNIYTRLKSLPFIEDIEVSIL